MPHIIDQIKASFVDKPVRTGKISSVSEIAFWRGKKCVSTMSFIRI